jgi:plastocyanin
MAAAASGGNDRAGSFPAACRALALLAPSLAVFGLSACTPALPRALWPPWATGAVEGRVLLEPGGAQSADSLQVVVYLDPLDGKSRVRAPARVGTIRRAEGRFEPELLTIARGQTVRFSNEEETYHRIFSSSTGNVFDLGLLKTGDARDVALDHAGAVRVYCRLHPWEAGVIFVAPTPHFQTLEPPGRYTIAGVPPGDYRLATWADVLHSADDVVTVRPRRATSVELALQHREAGP